MSLLNRTCCVISIVLLAYLTVTSGQPVTLSVSPKDDIEALPQGGGKWTFPEDCPSNCRYIEWLPTPSAIQFTIRGKFVGYVALAISVNTDMFGTDNAYICSRTSPSSSNFQFRSAVLVGEVPPIMYEQITNYTANATDGWLTCTFSRPLSVTQTVSGQPVTWDLSTTNFNMLYAEGLVLANGSIIEHAFRAHTNKAFSYLTNTGYRQQGPPPLPPSLPTISTSVANVSSEDNIVAMASGGGKWTFPKDCTSKCRYIEWEPIHPSIKFTIRGRANDYIALAISLNTHMSGDDDAYICSRTLPNSSDYELRSAVLVGEVEPIILGKVTNYTASNADGDLICTFWRPLTVRQTVQGKQITWNLLTTDFNMLYAEGAINSSGSILEHTYRTHTHGAFSYVNNMGYHQPEHGSATRCRTPYYLTALVLMLTVLHAW